MTKTTTEMTLQEAIVARHSVRQYFDKPIEAEKIQQLYRHDMQERRFRQAQGPSLRDAAAGIVRGVGSTGVFGWVTGDRLRRGAELLGWEGEIQPKSIKKAGFG